MLDAAAACRMARGDAGKRYPAVILYLAVCAVRSAALVLSWHDQALYRLIFEATFPITLLLEGTAIVAVFWVLVERYPRFRVIGAVGLTILAVSGSVAAWIIGNHGVPINPIVRQAELLTQRNASLVAVAVLAGVRVFLPRTSRLPIRASATVAAAIFGLDTALCLLLSSVSLVAVQFAGHLGVWARFSITLLPMVERSLIALLWLVWLPAVSPEATEPVRTPDREELEREAYRLALSSHMAAAQLREAVRMLNGK